MYIVRVHFYNTGKWTRTHAVRSQISGYPRGGGRQWLSGRDDKSVDIAWFLMSVLVTQIRSLRGPLSSLTHDFCIVLHVCDTSIKSFPERVSINRCSPMHANANILDMF